jgi:TRAP-type mannitol/chloroaromatic compound transport system permease large subunit
LPRAHAQRRSTYAPIKHGYPPWVAAGLVATRGGIALLIPPRIPLILYGVVTETSVVRLFFAGVIPGLLLALIDRRINPALRASYRPFAPNAAP